MYFINTYCITRHYGGPEEGGWWYNFYEPVKSRRTRKSRKAQEWAQEDDMSSAGRSWGNLYSVAGGEKYFTCVESRVARASDIPHYE